MVAQHTPTPWMSHSIGDMSPAEIRDLNEPTVAHCGDYCITIAGARGYDLHRSDAEDAAFIVRACNSHDDLLAALKLALTGFEAFAEAARGNSDLWMPTVLAIDTISIAIVKATADAYPDHPFVSGLLSGMNDDPTLAKKEDGE